MNSTQVKFHLTFDFFQFKVFTNDMTCKLNLILISTKYTKLSTSFKQNEIMHSYTIGISLPFHKICCGTHSFASQ